jgi:two-component system, response regulator YesN
MDERVRIVIAHIEHNTDKSQNSLKELADAVHLSTSRLAHLFKAETGVPITRYLRESRMRIAKQLLEGTFLNVKEIMFRVGVNDESHFVRDFKRIYGVTPGQYRKQFLSANSK